MGKRFHSCLLGVGFAGLLFVRADAKSKPPLEGTLEDRFHAAFDERGDARRGLAIHRIVENLTLADIPAALEVAAGAPQGGKENVRQNVYGEVYAKWAELDDPRKVLAAAEEIDDPTLRNPAVSKVVNRWARTDAPAALAYAKAFPPGSRRDAVIGNVLATWAQNDPDAVAHAIESAPDQFPIAAVTGIVSRIADGDPERAFALWEALAQRPGNRDAVRLTEMLGPIFNRFAQTDPAKAAEAALALPRPTWKTEALDSLANAWSIIDAPAALAWFSSAKEARFTPERVSSLFGNWARTDAPAAAVAATGLDERFRSDATDSVARWWGSRDPVAALAWVKTLPGSAARDGIIAEMLVTSANKRPQWAAEQMLGLSSGPARANSISSIVGNWATSDPVAAARWVSALPAGPERQAAVYRLVEGWVRGDPGAAAAYVAELPADQGRQEIVMVVATGWGDRDAAATAKWLQTLPAPDFEFVARNFVDVWMRHDHDGASEWAKALPRGRIRDVAIMAVCENVTGKEAATAMPVAATIGDDELRLQAMQAIARKWFAVDLDAAGEWVLKSDLSAEEKRKILSTAGSN